MQFWACMMIDLILILGRNPQGFAPVYVDRSDSYLFLGGINT